MKTEIAFRYLLISIFFGLINLGCTRKENESTDTSFRLLVVEQDRNQLKLFRSDGSLIDSFKVGYKPHEVELNRTNDKVYVSNFGVEDYDNTIGIPGTSLSVISLNNMSNIEYWPTYRSNGEVTDTCKAPHGLKLRPPTERELFVNLEFGDSMLVYDVKEGTIKRSFPLAKGVHNFEFSSSGDTIWSVAGANGLFQYDATTGKELGHFSTKTPVRGMTFTSDHQRLILSCKNEIYIIDPNDLSIEKHFTDLGVNQIIYSCLSPDGKLLFAPCPYDNVILVVDISTGEIKKRVTTGNAPICVRIGPQGRQAFVSNVGDDHMSVIDLSDFSVQPFGHVNGPNGFVFL